MTDEEFAFRRDLPSFRDFPGFVIPDRRPPVPEGFVVAIIGAGFAGLTAAVQLEQLGIPYVVFERRAEVGGTWSINRYPDVRVDTASITYECVFEKRYPWTEHFARGDEVRRYFDHVARTYGVWDHIRFEHDLETAAYDPEHDRWVLHLRTPVGGTTFEANVVITAVGAFANPKQPDFEGRGSFRGEILHPARWPDGFDATGRRVAIIGNGSTGVQLLAPIAADAAQVHVFQRTPQWIIPRPGYGEPVEPEVRWLVDNFPGYWNWWRYVSVAALFDSDELLWRDEAWVAKGGRFNERSDALRDQLEAYIRQQVGDRPDLLEKLIPDYAPFSRRLVVDNGWYAALTRDNVELVTDGIRRLTPTGIETVDGTTYDVDVIVTATGFEVARYLWPADFIGVEGTSIHEFWSKDGPRAYLSMMVPGFPNLFMLYGPNSQPVAGGVGLPVWYALWSAYAARCMLALFERGRTRVEVTMQAYERYNAELDAEASELLLLQPEGAPDRNYYVNQQFKRLQFNAPWSGPEYFRRCAAIDPDDVVLS